MVLFPLLTNEFVWSEPAKCFEPTGEIVGREEVCEMLAQLVMCFVIEALDRRLLDRAVHPFYLTVDSGVLHLGQTVLDVVIVTDTIEDVVEGIRVDMDWRRPAWSVPPSRVA